MPEGNLNKTSQSVVFRLVQDENDIPDIIDLARTAHIESRFCNISFSEEKTRRIALSAIQDGRRHAVFLATIKGQAAGFAYCSIGEYHIGQDALIATIHNINVIKGLRSSLVGGRIALGLFSGAYTWSKSKGAKELLFHVTSGVELSRTHALAKRMGYEVIGASYAKKLV